MQRWPIGGIDSRVGSRPVRLAALAGLLALAGCMSSPGIEVTRFHLGQPIPSDEIALEPPPGVPATLEFQTYANALNADLAAVGLRRSPGGTGSAYVGVLGITQQRSQRAPKPPALSIGLGGGTGGYGGGVGGGVTVPVGKGSSGLVVVTTLALQIKRRSDGTVVWEGRATGENPAEAPGSTISAALPALAHALLSGFPGESGKTVVVKAK